MGLPPSGGGSFGGEQPWTTDVAKMEGSEELSCDVSQQDCHLLVVERDEGKPYEVYHGAKERDDITAMGLFVWDLDKSYPQTLRGNQCTSAEPPGFPIAGLTPTADDVAAGSGHHAL